MQKLCFFFFFGSVLKTNELNGKTFNYTIRGVIGANVTGHGGSVRLNTNDGTEEFRSDLTL